MSIQSRALRLLCLPAFLVPSLAWGSVPTEAQTAQLRPSMEYILDLCAQDGWRLIGIWLLVSSAVSFVLLWIVAKLLAGERGTLKNVLIYTLQMWIVTILFLGTAYFSIQTGSDGIFLIALLIALIGMFFFACKTFEISFVRSIAFIIAIAITNPIGDYLSQFITGPLPWVAFLEKPPEEQKQILDKWQREKKQGESTQAAAPVTASANQKPATVHELYAHLQKARAELNVNDPAAVARFNEQVAAYNAAKAAAAPPPAPAAPTNSKASESAKSGSAKKKKETDSQQRKL